MQDLEKITNFSKEVKGIKELMSKNLRLANLQHFIENLKNIDKNSFDTEEQLSEFLKLCYGKNEISSSRNEKSSEISPRQNEESSEISSSRNEKSSEISPRQNEESSEISPRQNEESSEISPSQNEESSEIENILPLETAAAFINTADLKKIALENICMVVISYLIEIVTHEPIISIAMIAIDRILSNPEKSCEIVSSCLRGCANKCRDLGGVKLSDQLTTLAKKWEKPSEGFTNITKQYQSFKNYVKETLVKQFKADALTPIENAKTQAKAIVSKATQGLGV